MAYTVHIAYESQKGINAIQQCSVQNQKGANIRDNVHR